MNERLKTPDADSTNSSDRPRLGLDVRDISIAFGGLKAVQQFSLDLPAGALQGLIGPNGAGKTTVFNLLTGVYRPDSGAILLGERDLSRSSPHQIAQAGIARTFQNIRLFPDLTVLDNVRLAGQLRQRHNLISTVFHSRRFRDQERALEADALRLLDIFELSGVAHHRASSLSYGRQRHLEIVRALATGPHVLLLDEPAAGLNPQEKKELARSIQDIRRQFGISILLIEHDMGLVMDICEQIVVLDHGETICRGTRDVVQSDPQVIAAYLGAADDSA